MPATTNTQQNASLRHGKRRTIRYGRQHTEIVIGRGERPSGSTVDEEELREPTDVKHRWGRNICGRGEEHVEITPKVEQGSLAQWGENEPRRSSVALREVAKLHQIQPADLLRS